MCVPYTKRNSIKPNVLPEQIYHSNFSKEIRVLYIIYRNEFFRGKIRVCPRHRRTLS